MKENKPLITIVTVTFNAEKYLEDTIKSILEQTYDNKEIEYIIIDGKSNDKTIDIIKKYDKHINYWLSEPDKGIFDAMNKAIDMANGQWINFLNAGDTFYNNDVLSKISSHLKQDTDILLSNTNLIKINEKNKIFKANIENIYKTTPCFHQSQFVKTSLLKKFKYNTKYKIVCDYEFMIKCFINNYNFKVVDLVTVNFIPGGFSTTHAQEAMIEGMMILKENKISFNIIYESQWMKGLIKKHQNENSNLYFSKSFNKYIIQLNQVKKYTNIALYGYGSIGKNIEQILGQQIKFICDQTFQESSQDGYLKKLNDIREKDFDILIITVLGREKEIMKFLIHTMQIPEHKIFTFEV